MIEPYTSKQTWLPQSAFRDDVQTNIETFIVETRECFVQHAGRAPFVEATFAEPELASNGLELDVEVFFSWSPPRLHFSGMWRRKRGH